MDQKMNYPLFGNGLDFIYAAVERLGGQPSARDLKYAVLHLCSGIELVFKERLRAEHWSLLFDNVDKALAEKYKKGEFNSVNFGTVIERVSNICQVPIQKEEKELLMQLRNKRNRIEHFGANETVEEVTLITAAVLGYILDFIRFEIKVLDREEEQILAGIRMRLGGFKQFVDYRLKEIEAKLTEEQAIPIECPVCHQNTMVLGDIASCMFCHAQPKLFTGYGYLGDLYRAYWAVRQGSLILPAIKSELGIYHKAKEAGHTIAYGGFPLNVFWALAHIDDDLSRAILEEFENIDPVGKYALIGFNLRRKLGQEYGVLFNNKEMKRDCARRAETVELLSEGTEIQILKSNILNSSEMGPRGGASCFDLVKSIQSKNSGYIQRAGDNFPPYI